jgi:hypothetical protein
MISFVPYSIDQVSLLEDLQVAAQKALIDEKEFA